MTEVLKLEIAVISLVHLFAILLSVVCLAVFFMKTRRDDHAANAFIVMQVAMIMWMVFKIFKTVAPEVNLRWIFILGYYACTCVLEIAFVEFGYAYYRGKPFSSKIRRVIYLLPLMQFSWILTNPWHNLFYSHYDFWGDRFGPLFYLHMGIEYAFIIAGFFFCTQRFRRDFSGKNKIVTRVISTAIVVPLVLNLLYVTKIVHGFVAVARIPVVFDITPIVFTWSTLLFMYVTFNHDFISLSPLMRHEITHHLNLALGLFTEKLHLRYGNQAFLTMMEPAGRRDQILRQLPAHAADGGEVGYEEVVGDETFYIYCKSIRHITSRQYLVSIRNISEYKMAQADIAEKAKAISLKNRMLEQTIEQTRQLSKQSAHKYVAREIHDIIGHSLVAAVKLLEVSKIYMIMDVAQGKVALENAGVALETGMSGFKSILVSENAASRKRTGEDLKKSITAMAETLKDTGLELTLSFKGIIYLLDHQLYQSLERISTELMTNCLKHARASRLFLSLKIRESDISFLAVDNGVGVRGGSAKGSGLAGIEERVKALNGSVVFNPVPNDGFMVRIHISRSLSS